MALQRILRLDPDYGIALYQLSQVYLEQNKTRPALEVIRKAYRQGCETSAPRKVAPTTRAAKRTDRPCIWGPKCTTKSHLCIQIVIQEADILRTMREYKLASQVGLCLHSVKVAETEVALLLLRREL